MGKRVVLFDLGDTLVSYYRGGGFRPVLERCLATTYDCLLRLPLPAVPAPPNMEVAWAENVEAPDHRVTPLEERLDRIFRVDFSRLPVARREAIAQAFLAPIFALGRPYSDTLPVLGRLRERGQRLGIVSNTPWGSPSAPWRREVARHGLADLCEYVGFCVDCGWRKPASQPFVAALAYFGVRPDDCLFVGDNLRWDVEGARAAGLDAVLLDRNGESPQVGVPRMTTLEDLLR